MNRRAQGPGKGIHDIVARHSRDHGEWAHRIDIILGAHRCAIHRMAHANQPTSQRAELRVCILSCHFNCARVIHITRPSLFYSIIFIPLILLIPDDDDDMISKHQIHQHQQPPMPAATAAAVPTKSHNLTTSNQAGKRSSNKSHHHHANGKIQKCKTIMAHGNGDGLVQSMKSKRIRTIFTPEQLERLEQEFKRQQYMVGTGRLILASMLNLTEAQVKVWFQVSCKKNSITFAIVD